MSKRSLPQYPPLYSRVDVAIGSRLNLTSQRGMEHAKLVWFAVLERQNWWDHSRPSWATNTTLMHNVGLEFRDTAEKAVRRLREAGMLATPTGVRPTAKRKRGRVFNPAIGGPVRLLIPDRTDVANLWALCREQRERPAPMVTMMFGAYALASDHAERTGLWWRYLGHDDAQWTPLGCTMAEWRRFVGARKNASWTKRVRECEALDLIRRKGRAVEVAPTRSWLRAARALDWFAESRGPPLAA